MDLDTEEIDGLLIVAKKHLSLEAGISPEA